MFRSLRTRLILPLLLVSAAATTLVAAGSYALAARTADEQIQQRLAAIAAAIDRSDFPLSRNVVVLLSELTSATWVTLDLKGRVVESSIDLSDRSTRELWERQLAAIPVSPASAPRVVRLEIAGGQPWGMRLRSARNLRRGGVGDASEWVVLFHDAQWRELRLRAVAAPLLTGMATIGLLTAVTLGLVGRLVRRVTRLQRQVEAIAEGNFAGELVVGPNDEVGQLALSVRALADQLSRLWQVLSQRQGQRLLHQVAGGLAHNLRNTLTGARMAIELAARDRPLPRSAGSRSRPAPLRDHDDLQVAIQQLEQAEDYVQRLLLVSRGKQEENRPTRIVDCLEGLRGGLENSARHWGASLSWQVDWEGLANRRVADGPSLSAAVSNLIWNALQAGKEVRVAVELDREPAAAGDGGRCRIDVSDDGPGPAAEVAEMLFEPFVTTKPEGLGLGLSLVRRAADAIGGEVHWFRRADRTHFQLHFPWDS